MGRRCALPKNGCGNDGGYGEAAISESRAAETAWPGSARPAPAGRGGNGRRLPVNTRIAAGHRRRARRARSRGAGGDRARPPRHPARPRRERGGRPVRTGLRPCPGSAVADGDESPHRGRTARRGARIGRPRHGSAAAGARAPPMGEGGTAAPRTRIAPPHRSLRRRCQRMDRDAGGSAASRIPAPRIRARSVDRGRHHRMDQGHGPRPRARVGARPHAASHVAVPHAGSDPRLLYAVPARQTARRRASGAARIRGRNVERAAGGRRALTAGTGAASLGRLRARAGKAQDRRLREPTVSALAARAPRSPRDHTHRRGGRDGTTRVGHPCIRHGRAWNRPATRRPASRRRTLAAVRFRLSSRMALPPRPRRPLPG